MMFRQAGGVSQESPFRPNYEIRGAALWAAAGLYMLLRPSDGLQAAAGSLICLGGALRLLVPGIRLFRRQQALRGRPLEFTDIRELGDRIAGRPGECWLGRGFLWEASHTLAASQIAALDESTVTPARGLLLGDFLVPGWLRGAGAGAPGGGAMGSGWIHGLGAGEEDLYQPLRHAEGHTLIVGTTGAGKTRMFDLLISQAVLRGEAVIIIDPKGDKEMAANALRACRAAGAPERFIMFNPAFPEESVRLDPLANFSRPTELASRIAALMTDTGGSSATFRAFSWQAVNNIVQGEVICGRRPTLIRINHYLAGGCAELVTEAVQAWGRQIDRNFDADFAPWERRMTGQGPERQAALMRDFYRRVLGPLAPSPDLESLLSMFEHDSAHFSKMVAGLLPMMSMLTSGSLGELLSPDFRNLSDPRKLYDTRQIINSRKVAYIGLDSLTDAMVGSAIGSLILSDLTSVAGDRYNYGEHNMPVNIFVDEAAETINDPMIAMLNKGRGAGFRLYVATQTFADFAARLGSRDKATQVLGNINNVFALRITDLETQEYVTGKLPAVKIGAISRSASLNTGSVDPALHSGGEGETLAPEEVPLFPSSLLGRLPNLEYLANLSGGRILKGRLPILTCPGEGREDGPDSRRSGGGAGEEDGRSGGGGREAGGRSEAGAGAGCTAAADIGADCIAEAGTCEGSYLAVRSGETDCMAGRPLGTGTAGDCYGGGCWEAGRGFSWESSGDGCGSGAGSIAGADPGSGAGLGSGSGSSLDPGDRSPGDRWADRVSWQCREDGPGAGDDPSGDTGSGGGGSFSGNSRDGDRETGSDPDGIITAGSSVEGDEDEKGEGEGEPEPDPDRVNTGMSGGGANSAGSKRETEPEPYPGREITGMSRDGTGDGEVS